MFCAAKYFSSLGSEKSSVPTLGKRKAWLQVHPVRLVTQFAYPNSFVSCRKDADTRRSLGFEPYLFHPGVPETMPLLYCDVVELPNSDSREILRTVLGHGSI